MSVIYDRARDFKDPQRIWFAGPVFTVPPEALGLPSWPSSPSAPLTVTRVDRERGIVVVEARR